MHEISICEGILQALEAEAIKQSFSKIKTVILEIGDLSSIELDALNFGFDVVTKNSIADGARLEIIRIPGAAWCMKCSKNVYIKRRFDECPDCGSYQLQITGGEEMRIKELEVD